MTHGLEGAGAARVRLPTEQEQAAKVALRARVERDRADLVFRFPFLARLAMHLEIVPVVDDRVPTAATDGHTIWLNPRFLDDVSDEERLFVVGHEVWHCALGHFARGEGRDDDELWNIAVDHEVNALLGAEGMTVPADAVLLEQHRGEAAEEIYELLRFDEEFHEETRRLDAERVARNAARDDVEHEDPADTSGDPDESGEYVYDLFAAFRGAPPLRPPDRGRFADVHGLPEIEGAAPPAPAEGDGEVVLDPDFQPQAPPPVEVWEERLIVAVQQAPGAADALGETLARILRPLREPTVPWQEVLRQFVTAAYGGERRWLPSNRRYVHQGLYLPSRRTERLRLVVAVDTSGSTQPFLEDFASELVGLLDSFGGYQLTLICADDAVRSVREFDSDRPLTADDLRFDGGCGTDFRPVFAWVEREQPEADVLVYLTDGYGEAPREAPGMPVLWALTAGDPAPAEWGRAVQLGTDAR